MCIRDSPKPDSKAGGPACSGAAPAGNSSTTGARFRWAGADPAHDRARWSDSSSRAEGSELSG
eukprot:12829776-Alexandrium_andersonii.AAC.1